MKKFKSLVLAVIGLLCSVSVSAHNFYVDGIYYNYSDKVNKIVEVTYKGNSYGSYNEYSGDVTIPESVTYDNVTYKVEGITSHAFRSCTNLTSVIVPNSITKIGEYAFAYCSALTSVTMGNSVKEIGDDGFYECSNLKEVHISDLTAWCAISFYDVYANPLFYAKHLFLDGEEINDLVIPDNVTSIKFATFYNCEGLISVTISDNITSIKNRAFRGCTNLESIDISTNVTSIGTHAFYNCDKLSFLNLPSKLQNVGNYAFYDCDGLEVIVIPDSVTTIGEQAFYSCDNLSAVSIGKSVTSIGSSAFAGCLTLRTIANNSSLNFTKGTTTHGYIAYYAYRILTGENVDGYYFDGTNEAYKLTGYWGDDTNLILPEKYNGQGYSIAANAFRGTNITSVKIPNSVTSIENYAFYSCADLKSLTIGSGVLSVGSNQCTPIKTIWLTNTPPSGAKSLQGTINYVANEQYSSLSNVKVYPYLSSVFEAGGVKYVPVSPSERTCDAIDCNYDSAIVNMDIDKQVLYRGVSMTVKAVMPYTAYGQKSVETVSVSHEGNVGQYAFKECTALKTANINIGDPNKTAEPLFFDDWTSTNTAHSSTSENTYSFTLNSSGTLSFEWWVSSESNCDKLIVVLDGTTILTKSGGLSGTYSQTLSRGSHSLIVKYTKDSNTTRGEDKAQVFNIGVKISRPSVEKEAFRGCTSLANLTLGEDVGTIDESAFRGCSSLTNLLLPNRITTLDNYCFEGCAISSISIPASVTKIGDYTFDNCSQLADVIIADRTTDLTLGSNGKSPLFSDCPLDSVYIGGNISYNTSSSYGYSPFYRNTSLRAVVITDKEEEISDNEFYGCTNLKNVTIGGDVKKIGNWAFSGCSNLDYFSFGKSVETIGQEAFSDCVNLKKLISYAEVPPTCGSMALDDINKWDCILQVPQSCLAAYQQANQWKEFFFIEDVLTAIDAVTIDGATPAISNVYNTNGVLIKSNADLKNLKNELPAGIYIIGGKKVYVR